ncbi:MAG: class I SAM-dependent methyltransferase [Candidatus Omnitrophica bacterium]|nr:class I SAM-dependent methyltransferase [Candidatus Omnitrophota bacterium]
MRSQQDNVRRFAANWKKRETKKTNWFCKGRPQNQIELAFQQHFSFLKEVVKIPSKGHCLEVGAGRGSLSSFFAQSGYSVTLVDIVPEVLKDAEEIFKKNKHAHLAQFVVADAHELPFEDEEFDVITSIGLLEHFKTPSKIIEEQIRVLKKGGVFTAYVVPEKTSVQTVFKPVNDVLKKAPVGGNSGKKNTKKPLYRNDYDSGYYVKLLQKNGLKAVKASGVYPFPAISFSPEFPFTLMPSAFERALVTVYENLLSQRRKQGSHPWACDESWGQAFFVWGRK